MKKNSKTISDEVVIEENVGLRKKLVKRAGKIILSTASAMFLIGSASVSVGAIEPVDAAKEVIASEGGKEAINHALKMAKSKPALSIAAAITCAACVPVAGAASPGLCIACGILIAKVVG